MSSKEVAARLRNRKLNYDVIDECDKPARSNPGSLSDEQLYKRLCKGQLCELCRMRCVFGDELARRGLKSVKGRSNE